MERVWEGAGGRVSAEPSTAAAARRGDRLVSLVTHADHFAPLVARAQFHNAMHAADVVQAVYSMLHAVHMLPKLTELEVFAVLLAAAAHGASQVLLQQLQPHPHCWHCVRKLQMLGTPVAQTSSSYRTVTASQ